MSRVSQDELRAATWTAVAKAKITVAAASARNGSDLAAGTYYMTVTTNTWFLQGDSTVEATTSSNYAASGSTIIFKVTGAANARMAVLRDSADGSAIIMQPQVP